MSRRERVLIALMGGAVTYGMVVYLLPDTSAPAREAAPAVAEEQARAFATMSSERLGAVTCAPRVSFAEACMGRPWTNSPFALLPGEVAVASADAADAAEPAGPVRFSGYVTMDGRRLAVLNGRAYGVGARVADGAYSVVSISENQVVLSREDEGERVVLTLENETKRGGTR